MTSRDVDAAASAIVRRAEERFVADRDRNYRATDRMFAWLMLIQWIAGIVVAVTLSPYAWEGKIRSLHIHVWLATFLGAAISSLPILLALTRPGHSATRHVIAVGQLLWSALLIHLSGGRIETHFHVFGSLGFLAGYRDWTVLVTAATVIAGDHLVRGLLWPESVYGITNREWWRFLEHAFWVVFAISFLIVLCLRSLKEMRIIAERSAEIEALSEGEWRAAIDDRPAAEPAIS